MSNVNGESDVSPTKPQTTRTDGSFSRGNWEIPETSLSLEMDRSGKARCHHPDMHVAGKSDSLVVPAKQANKAGPQTAAESVEERRLTKENASQPLLVRTQSRVIKSRGLFGVRATTQRDRGDLIPMRRDSSISKVGAAYGENGYRHRGRSQSPFSPYAVVPHARICAGGGQQWPSLPRSPRTMRHSSGFFMLVGSSPRFSTDCDHRGIIWSYSIGPPGRWLPASEERLSRRRRPVFSD